jgi:predicted kinase
MSGRHPSPFRKEEGPLLIAMAGLPGTGKSTIASRLAQEIGAVILNKDRVRAVLFPAPVLDYSTRQNDISMAAIYQAARAILEAHPHQPVILDGRTFLGPGQVRDLFTLAGSLGTSPRIIECVCAGAIVRQRLERDQAAGEHPARNRTFALYQSLKAKAVPISAPHLVVDTGGLSLEECVQRCKEYVVGSGG